MNKKKMFTALIAAGVFWAAFPPAALAQKEFDFKNPRIPFSDQAVEKSIDKAVAYLLSRQQADGSWPRDNMPKGPSNPNQNEKRNKARQIGASAMALYSLMEKGLTPKDSKIAKGLEWLEKESKDLDYTYSVAFCCQVWLRAYKQAKDKDKDAAAKYRKLLETDVNKLIAGVNGNGGYFYELKSNANDPSNSQYGVLGVWAGYRALMEIQKEYWEKILKYWVATHPQNADGGWNYETGESTYTMTAAGIATLFVCIDALKGDEFIRCNVQHLFAPIEKGLKWYDDNFKKIISEKSFGRQDMYYGLYGIERIGLASGYKYFGDADWYKYGATRILNCQESDGSCESPWGPDVATAYALLFLIRGQRGVLFNRLEYDGDWNNRPRALANFCRWAEGVYENEVKWQIITLKSAAGEWHDAPILAISGAKPPKFSDEDIVRLRTYVNQGGTIFSITECSGAAAFGNGMKAVYRKIFPKYELTLAGREHPIFTCQYKLPGVPAFHIVSNGIRPLAIHTDADLPLHWQTYAVATGRQNFEAAANVLMYVTDKQIKNRGANVWPEEPARAAGKALKAARIRFAGNYDPEPLALQRLSRELARLHDLRLQMAESPASAPASGLPEAGLLPSELTSENKIAFLTGTGGFSLPKAEKDALKKWVDGGGLLVIDAAGSNKSFAESSKDLIGELWGGDSLLPLPMDNPLYQLKDMKIETVKYRRVTRGRIGGNREPRLTAVLAGDRPKVIFSAEDLTGGLVGYSTLGMDGYENDSAFDVMRNICVYALTAPALPPSSAPATKPETR